MHPRHAVPFHASLCRAQLLQRVRPVLHLRCAANHGTASFSASTANRVHARDRCTDVE